MRDEAQHIALQQLSDGELIGLTQQGNRAAFESLFHRHQDRVFTLALGIVGNHADAKDVVQETFLKTYKRIKSIDTERAVLAYLLKTASNTAIDTLRARKTNTLFSIDAQDSPQIQSTQLTPQNIAERAGDEQHLFQAVLSLPDHQRVVIVLHHIRGLPVDAIAKRLRIPEGTVKSRLGRAREVLRRKLIGKIL